MLTPLTLGLPIILPRSLTGPDIQKALREGRVTVLVGVPRLYRALYEAIVSQAKQSVGEKVSGAIANLIRGNSWLRKRVRFANGGVLFRSLRQQIGPELRMLASGGSPLDPELAWRLEGLGWKVTIGYGLTETSPLLTIHPPGGGHLETVGRAIKDVEMRIDQDWKEHHSEKTDDANGNDAEPEDENEGEILVRGPSVFKGYWNLPEKTEQALTSDGWFRTGDLGYLDQQDRLHVTGRVSTLIITEGGEKVQPDEIEAADAEADEIREIGVLQRDQQLLGLVVPETANVDTDDDINQQIRKAIDRINKKLPSHQHLNDVVITRKALPRTRIGKIRRKKLKEHFEEAQKGDGGDAGPLSRDEMSSEDPGLGILLERHPVPVVSVYLEGTHEALPRGSHRPGKPPLRFAPPLDRSPVRRCRSAPAFEASTTARRTDGSVASCDGAVLRTRLLGPASSPDRSNHPQRVC